MQIAITDTEVTQLLHQGGIGVIAVYAIQYLKRADWFPWLSQQSGQVTKIIGVLIALLTSIGLKWAGDADHGWSMNTPPLTVMLSNAWDILEHAGAQFGGMQVLYHTAVKD